LIHLHNHTDFSLLDGAQKISDLVSEASIQKEKAVAITDHGNMAGWIRFQNLCNEYEIKPIFGIEMYISIDSKERSTNHITLLAKDNIGIKNLIKLNNIAYLEKFYYKPRVTFQDLFDHKEGLVVLSGCVKGLISQLLLRDEDKLAYKWVDVFKDNFKDDFYLEIMNQNLEFQIKLNKKLTELSKKTETPLVATNDCHYTTKDNYEIWELIKCNRFKWDFLDQNRNKLPNSFYYKDVDLPEEYKQKTYEISEKCNAILEPFKNTIPHIGKIENFIDKKRVTDKKRLQKEYNIFDKANLLDYFCVVADYIKFAKSNGIGVGPSRGSVAGSLLAYATHITEINPLDYSLFFSRFYNEGRKGSMPDIDTDFSPSRIGDIKNYIKSKYGTDHIASIGDASVLKTRGAIKMVCRAMKIPFVESNILSKAIGEIIDDLPKQSLNDPSFQLPSKWSQYYKVIKLSSKLEGIRDKVGVHPAGTIISSINLKENIPLKKDRDNNIIVSQWDMHDVEKMGFIKFDMLALDAVDTIDGAIKFIKER